MNTLQFLLRSLDRKLLIYWDSEARQTTVIDTETMFDGDCDDPDDFNDEEQNYICLRAILRESEAKLEMKNYNPPSFFVWR